MFVGSWAAAEAERRFRLGLDVDGDVWMCAKIATSGLVWMDGGPRLFWVVCLLAGLLALSFIQ